MGGSGGNRGEYSLQNATQIDVHTLLVERFQTVGKIVIHYSDGTTKSIGRSDGLDGGRKVVYDLSSKSVVDIVVTKIGTWTGLVGSIEFLLKEDDSVVPVPPPEPVVSAPMKFRIETTNTNQSFTISANPEYTYSYDVDCGNDGEFETTNITGAHTCNYTNAGEYTIAIQGTFPHFYLPASSKAMLTQMLNWGTIEWLDFTSVFEGAQNMRSDAANDSPDLSRVVSMYKTFYNSRGFNDSELRRWDVSNIRNMSYAFADSDIYNGVENWDVSNVTDMSFMFAGNSTFNDSIGGWDVSNVINMESMFEGTSSFFFHIPNWDVSNVINMRRMFYGASSFRGGHDEVGHISSWNVRVVNNMMEMFAYATALTKQDLSQWNVFNVTNYRGFTTGWGVDNVEPNWPTRLNRPFQFTIETTEELKTFKIQVDASRFPYNYEVDCNSDGIWEARGIRDEDFVCVYDNAKIQYISINGWYPFFYRAFDEPVWGTMMRSIEQWGTVPWVSFESFFRDITTMTGGIRATDTPNLTHLTSMRKMFYGSRGIQASNLNDWDVSGVVDMSYAFADSDFDADLSAWNTQSVHNMSHMFDGTNWNYDIGDWDVDNVTNMSFMFRNNRTFNQNLLIWEPSSVTTMQSMFEKAYSFNGYVYAWDVSKVTNMSHTFAFARSFQGWKISRWDTSSAVAMDAMFAYATNLTDADLAGSWNVANVRADRHKYFGLGWGKNNAEPSWADTAPATGMEAFKFTIEAPTTIFKYFVITPHPDYEYSYNVDCNSDGSLEVSNTSEAFACMYASSGIHTISITGTFPRLYLPIRSSDEKGKPTERSMIKSIEQWGNIQWKTFENILASTSNMTAINAQDIPDLSQVTSMEGAFVNSGIRGGVDFSLWDVSNVTNMRDTFSYSQINPLISEWDVSNVTTMNQMFNYNPYFNQDLSRWDVSNVTSLRWMFHEAHRFTSDLSNWDVSSATNASWMFNNAHAFNSDLASWSTGSLTDVDSMFYRAYNFTNNDLSGWDVSNVESHDNFLKKAGAGNIEPNWP